MSKFNNNPDNARSTPITLKDIAAIVGVSVSTVSRVLDERLPKSKSKSADLIRDTAKKLGYTRDVMASSLRRGGTGTIGVLVPHLTDTVMAILYEEIAKSAQQSGYFTIVATCGDDENSEIEAVDSLLSRRVDGLILATARINSHSAKKLRDTNIPHALVLRTDYTSNSVIGDDILGGYLATRHLLDLGHERIGIILGPSDSSNSQGRLDGYRKALEESNHTFDKDLCIEDHFDFESGERCARKFFSSKNPPTAIFAVSDNIALGVMSAAKDLDLLPGTDFSLVGYNDTPIATRIPISLSSVNIPLDYISYKAIDLLFSEKKNEVIKIMPTLVPRDSSKWEKNSR